MFIVLKFVCCLYMDTEKVKQEKHVWYWCEM